MENAKPKPLVPPIFSVTINSVKIMIYTRQGVDKYQEIAGDPRFISQDNFINLPGSGYWQVRPSPIFTGGFFIRSNMTRKDLYQAAGYQTYDFAYPEPWSDSPEAIRLFKANSPTYPVYDPDTGEEKGRRTWQRGDPRPALVWCYDPPEGSDRHSLLGYPVFDREAIAKLAKLISEKVQAGEIERLPYADRFFDPDLYLEIQ